MLDQSQLKPGDVICVATHDVGGWFIRLRSWLMRQPAKDNHVAMFTHLDSEGFPRGLEGRPGGFGWANLDAYCDDPSAVSNAGQTTFSLDGRAAVVARAIEMVGIPYDWRAILDFALQLVGRRFRAPEWPEDGLPSEVECASAIDLLYEEQGWPNPGGWRKTRGTDVDDWVSFIQEGKRA